MSRYPEHLAPKGMSKGQKSRARREPSGVFSLFQAPQIQQFKEAFQLIDHDKDGWVNESDLKEIFASLGGSCVGWVVALLIVCRDLAGQEDAGGAAECAAGDAAGCGERAGDQLYDVPDDDERAAVRV